MPSAISAPIPGSVAALYMRNEVQVTLNPEVRMKLLVKIAEPTEQIKQDVPIQRLLRTMLEMVRLGNLYFGDKDYEKAFIYYLRFMTILVETLPKHPGYDVCYSEEKRKVADIRTEVADRASEAKKRVKEVYEKESVALRERLENMRKKEDEETKRLAALAAENNQNPILSPTPPISNRGYDLDSLGDLVSKQETPLKHVLISCDLVAEFLKAASSNTLSNVETCAILSGKLERDSFVITHAILPKQQGDSDSCETLDEHEVYEYQERHGLISLGWIHTHPSQTAFLSSIDLHMQNSFQMLLDESIAIVCAPSRPQSAIYTLTKYGREVLTTCRKTGHHPHDNESKLYEEASHYRYLQGGDFKVIDFRM
ncbi:hypothetical protein QR680_016992 [Steinernema hermaphroditum]|uniref:MPN domain-containing protein n=1 Tax=Steinernema hermaphroditum TaxID=289476 RepID=A0AA39HCX5_9BILA|nr:hypothetical protein QR680_016992 [Steinernema hermaphroditum]